MSKRHLMEDLNYYHHHASKHKSVLGKTYLGRKRLNFLHEKIFSLRVSCTKNCRSKVIFLNNWWTNLNVWYNHKKAEFCERLLSFVIFFSVEFSSNFSSSKGRNLNRRSSFCNLCCWVEFSSKHSSLKWLEIKCLLRWSVRWCKSSIHCLKKWAKPRLFIFTFILFTLQFNFKLKKQNLDVALGILTGW